MTITKKQFSVLSDLAQYYNKKLFNGMLPDCLVSLTRAERFHGYYAPRRWKKKDAAESTDLIDEIVLNANSLSREDRLWHSTLVHEQVHQFEFHFGKRSNGGYHTKHFARMMLLIGLQASDTGRPGGKDTGYRMTHYIIMGGAFEKAFNAISQKDIAKYRLPLDSMTSFAGQLPIGIPPKSSSTSGRRTKYICQCQNNMWGKPGLSVMCNTCETNFKETTKFF